MGGEVVWSLFVLELNRLGYGEVSLEMLKFGVEWTVDWLE